VRDTTEGVPTFARFVPEGTICGAVSVTRVKPGNARIERRGHPDKLRCRHTWIRQRGARADDEERQTPATCKAKAAPADKARAVRHSRRREAPAFESQREGLAVDARARTTVG
jgi:hypothetical protein